MMSHTTSAQGSSVCARHLIHVSCACVCDLSSALSSQSSFLSPIFHFILLNFKIPGELRPMRSLALWPITILSQVMSPNSSTTTTSQRPLKFSSRSHPATQGPHTCMTRRSVTTPSADHSPHHCSLRSEKNQRAVHKLITLLKQVCRQVSLCLSFM